MFDEATTQEIYKALGVVGKFGGAKFVAAALQEELDERERLWRLGALAEAREAKEAAPMRFGPGLPAIACGECGQSISLTPGGHVPGKGVVAWKAKPCECASGNDSPLGVTIASILRSEVGLAIEHAADNGWQVSATMGFDPDKATACTQGVSLRHALSRLAAEIFGDKEG